MEHSDLWQRISLPFFVSFQLDNLTAKFRSCRSCIFLLVVSDNFLASTDRERWPNESAATTEKTTRVGPPPSRTVLSVSTSIVNSWNAHLPVFFFFSLLATYTYAVTIFIGNNRSVDPISCCWRRTIRLARSIPCSRLTKEHIISVLTQRNSILTGDF